MKVNIEELEIISDPNLNIVSITPPVADKEVEDEVDMLIVDAHDMHRTAAAREARANARADYDQSEGDGSLADQAAGKARSLCSARCRLSFVIVSCICVVVLLVLCVALGMELRGYVKQYLFRHKKDNIAAPSVEKTTSPPKIHKPTSLPKIRKPSGQPSAGPGKAGPPYMGGFGMGSYGTNILGKVPGAAKVANAGTPVPTIDTQGTLVSSRLKCKPTAIRGEHMVPHNEPNQKHMSCKPLEVLSKAETLKKAN